MASTVTDIQLAALATGFTLGFGVLTVWEAMKQTKRNLNRWKSQYIYMVWGEILANTAIVIVGWLFLHGRLGPTVPVLFSILALWVLEVQLLMQIIVNRIALIAENRSTIMKIKWGTAALITAINITVFCIWIPAHVQPPHPVFIRINEVWDKIEKVLILLVDATLNYYFLRTVKIRLVKQHGLKKYEPLVGFNAKLMVVSIGMDGMLIGLMFLKNQLVYILFHPVVYMVKLNIEMSMASLVVKLARGKGRDGRDIEQDYHSTDGNSHLRSGNAGLQYGSKGKRKTSIQLSNRPKRAGSMIKSLGLSKIDSDESLGGIQRKTDVNVTVEKIEHTMGQGSERSSHEMAHSVFSDDAPLRKNGVIIKEAPI